ncbi:Tctex-1 family-domain-containing protein [Obelidium mucronatum]|nr:Tctex-1 family-domain-containing protein [Obelidium mucronatum]
METTANPSGNGSHYSIRPNYKHKFKQAVVTRIIHSILTERLTGVTYQPDSCSQWTREISDEIKAKLKALELQRYKFVVNVVIGEMRGEGVRMGCRCLWDSDTDSMAQDVFMNDSLFCVAVAYGVYYY